MPNLSDVTEEEIERSVAMADRIGEGCVLANTSSGSGEKEKVLRYSASESQYTVTTVNGKHTKCAPFRSRKWALMAYNNFEI